VEFKHKTAVASLNRYKPLFMKLKIMLIIVALAMLSSSLLGQAAFGLKGGLNLTNIHVDDPEASYDSRAGFHAGIFLRGKFNKVGIQPEVLLFTQRAVGDYGSFGKIEDSFTYLSIPVMIKFYPVGGFNLQAGPQFGFLLDGERKFDSALGVIKRSIKNSYASSDVAISLGAGYDFGFGLGIDFRYNIGVKDINNEADGEAAKSRVFLLSLGWNFLK
jgi:hypothetical protein